MSTSKPIKPTLSPAATGVEGFMKIGKLINVIGILSVLMAVSVYAQESPPPPPAADFVASNWKEFISTDGSLSVLMPGIPTDVSQPVDTKSGSVAITLYALATRTAEYSVGYTTFAKNIETLQSSKLTLDGLRNRLAAKENGKVLDEQDIVSDGHPGRAVVIEVADGIFRDKYYLVGARIYTASVFMPKIQAASERDTQGIRKSQEEVANRFLNSFRLISK